MADLIRGAVLKGVPELIAELGGNPARLLTRFGFSVNDIDDPDRLISYRKFVQLLNAAAVETGCEHFGLSLSPQQNVATLGMLGIAMQQSPDVATALQTFVRYFYLHTQAASIEVEVAGSSAIGTFSVELAGIDNLSQVVDLSLGHGANIYRFLCGQEVLPKSIHFMHDKPEDVKPYKKVFKAPLLFNAEFNGLVYDAKIMAQPIRQHDEELHKVLTRHLHELEERHPNDIVSQVEHTIRVMLPTGNCSIDVIAGCLNMSKRTLQNRMKSEGATFQNLLDEVRSEIARSYLRDSKVSMTYLADILAYSELSAFSRAFKRWFGVSPKMWQASV
ncbi:MAG: AraC family transcriptional regulator [Pseudomonadales bacterium]